MATEPGVIDVAVDFYYASINDPDIITKRTVLIKKLTKLYQNIVTFYSAEIGRSTEDALPLFVDQLKQEITISSQQLATLDVELFIEKLNDTFDGEPFWAFTIQIIISSAIKEKIQQHQINEEIAKLDPSLNPKKNALVSLASKFKKHFFPIAEINAAIIYMFRNKKIPYSKLLNLYGQLNSTHDIKTAEQIKSALCEIYTLSKTPNKQESAEHLLTALCENNNGYTHLENYAIEFAAYSAVNILIKDLKKEKAPYPKAYRQTLINELQNSRESAFIRVRFYQQEHKHYKQLIRTQQNLLTTTLETDERDMLQRTLSSDHELAMVRMRRYRTQREELTAIRKLEFLIEVYRSAPPKPHNLTILQILQSNKPAVERLHEVDNYCLAELKIKCMQQEQYLSKNSHFLQDKMLKHTQKLQAILECSSTPVNQRLIEFHQESLRWLMKIRSPYGGPAQNFFSKMLNTMCLHIYQPQTKFIQESLPLSCNLSLYNMRQAPATRLRLLPVQS